MAGVERSSLHTPEALEASSTLLSNALHSVAQPLTVLAALLDEAEQRADRALGGDYLAIARSECHRAVAAVRSLQALSAQEFADMDVEGPR